MNLAELGYRIDTSDVSKGVAELERLGPATDKAERATEKLNTTFQKTGPAADTAANGITRKKRATDAVSGSSNNASAATNKLASELTKVGSAADAASGKVNRFNQVANDNAMIAKGGSLQVGNLAAQFQDIGVTAAMGMSPLQIALAQGTQISAVLGPLGAAGAVKALGSALMSVISPVSLVTIGLVALAAAGLQFVDWTSAAQSVLTFLADLLPMVAEYATWAGIALAAAFAPSIVAAIWGITTAIASGLLLSIGALITTVGAIPLAIGLIIADLIIFRDAWAQTLGFDIIDVTKRAVNIIIGSFVGAYHDIEFLWKSFPDVIGAAATGAANMVIRAVNAIVGATVDGINAVIQAANTVLSVGENLGLGSVSIGEVEFTGFEELANEAATRLTTAVKDRNKQLADDLAFDYVGAIGGAVNGAVSDISAKLRELSGGLGAVGDEADKASKKTKDPWNDLRKATEKTTSAVRDLVREVVKGIGGDLVNMFEDGKVTIEELANVALNALEKIADKLLELAFDDLLNGILGGGKTNQSGSLLSGLFNLVGGWLGFANGGAFENGSVVEKFANGGVVNKETPFNMAVMGEAGPEAIMPLSRMSDGSLGVAANIRNVGTSNESPSGSNRVEINVNVSGARGNSEIREMVSEGVSEGLRQYDQSVLPARVSEIADNPRIR